MYLPCPHCRKIFQIDPALIQADFARLRCPACGGRFILQKNDHARLPAESAVPPTPLWEAAGFASPASASAWEDLHSDQDHGAPSCPASPGREQTLQSGERSDDTRRFRPPFGVLWLLLPAFGLLLAMVGILMPVAGTDRLFPRQDGFVTNATTHEPAKSSQSSREQKTLMRFATDPMSSSLLLGLGMADPCQADSDGAPGPEESGEGRLCRLYPYWISFLSAPPSAAGTSACQPDSVFSETTEALRKGGLCADAHAFLAAYYIQKRVADRGQNCLQDARRAGNGSVWQRWVEVLYALRIDQDTARAEALLADLLKDFPDFLLGRYYLAKIQIEREQYESARETLASRPELGTPQTELVKIRRTLEGLEASSYYSAKRAAGLLSLARSFAALGETETAEKLFRRVLDGMPGRLAASEEKAAFFELGSLQEKRGDKEAAYSSYQNALKIDPRCPEVRERIQRLTSEGRESS